MDPYPSASGDGRRAVSWQATRWQGRRSAEGRRSAVATVDPPACELRIDGKVRRLRVRLEAGAPLVLLVKVEGVPSRLVLAIGVLHGERLLGQGACGATVRGTHGTPGAGTRTVYVPSTCRGAAAALCLLVCVACTYSTEAPGRTGQHSMVPSWLLAMHFRNSSRRAALTRRTTFRQ